ncbi:hypothetical protein [Xenorhabdus sp. SGI246]|uniref:hypothetical protein n=1 Tax=Xenorhabdus sp. SGI246 TaxID=3158263 RepID=UPI00349FB769
MIISLSERVRIQSLRLNIDTPFLAVPPSYDPDLDKIFTKVTTTVRDIYGNPLIGTRILVTDDSGFNLKNVKIFSSNHQDEITVESVNNQEGFHVETDDNGDILFFIQPVKSQGLIMQLYAQIAGNEKTISAADSKIYIVNNTLENISDKMLPPDIINFSGGYLKSYENSTFKVKIKETGNIINNGFILFFINDEYTKKFIEFSDMSDLENPFDLPCSIFKNKVLSYFSYIVISENGDIYPYKSRPLTLTYMREPNKPWSDVNRVYEPCVVYSSAGVFPENILKQYSTINDNKISTINSVDAGLYVEITGTSDPNDTSKVACGSKVTLNLYIIDGTGNFNWSNSATMPYPQEEINESLVFDIPREILENKIGFSNNLGKLYFDYQVGTDLDPDVSYSNTWFSHIVTYENV